MEDSTDTAPLRLGEGTPAFLKRPGQMVFKGSKNKVYECKWKSMNTQLMWLYERGWPVCISKGKYLEKQNKQFFTNVSNELL